MSMLENITPALRDLVSKIEIRHLAETAATLTRASLEELLRTANQWRDQALTAENINELFAKAMQITSNNPMAAASMVVITLLLVFPGVAAAPILSALGFTSPGPAAGSIAAFVQSKFGVTALFSTLQSAGMGGYGVATANWIVQGATLAAGALAGAFSAATSGGQN